MIKDRTNKYMIGVLIFLMMFSGTAPAIGVAGERTGAKDANDGNADLILPDGYELTPDVINEVTLIGEADAKQSMELDRSSKQIDLLDLREMMIDGETYTLLITGKMTDENTEEVFLYTIEEQVTKDEMDQISSFSVPDQFHGFSFPEDGYQATAVTDETNFIEVSEDVSGFYGKNVDFFDILFEKSTGRTIHLLDTIYLPEEQQFVAKDDEQYSISFEQDGEKEAIRGLSLTFERYSTIVQNDTVESHFTEVITNLEDNQFEFFYLTNEGDENPWQHTYRYQYQGGEDVVLQIPDSPYELYDLDQWVGADGQLTVHPTIGNDDMSLIMAGIFPDEGEYGGDIDDVMFREGGTFNGLLPAMSTMELFDEEGKPVKTLTSDIVMSQFNSSSLDDGVYEAVMTFPLGNEERLEVKSDIYYGTANSNIEVEGGDEFHTYESVTMSFNRAGAGDLYLRIMDEDGNERSRESITQVSKKTTSFLQTGVFTLEMLYEEEVIDSYDITIVAEKPYLDYGGDLHKTIDYGADFELPEVTVVQEDSDTASPDARIYKEDAGEVTAVDTSKPGNYSIIYTFTDEKGEDLEPFYIWVTVEEGESDKPVFSDLPDDYRFNHEIEFLSGMEVISGYLDGTFAPDGTVTRAAAATMIGRALELDGTQRDTDFPDVRDGNNASGYIQEAAELEIIQGFPDGTFRPNEEVTRGQMAIFIARAFEMETKADMDFSDISPSMEAYDSVAMILHEDITEGFPDGTYRPDDAVTRGQFSAFLSRTLDESFR